MTTSKFSATHMASDYLLLAYIEDACDNPSYYQSVVGSLKYLTITRPDLSYAVNKVCHFMTKPLIPYQNVLNCIIRYLNGSLSYGLFLRSST